MIQVLALASCLAGQVPLQPLAPLAAPAEIARVQTLQAQVAAPEPAARGRAGLAEVRFAAGDYPHVLLPAGALLTVTDWTPYGALVFDAMNPGRTPVTLSLRIDDRADGAGGHTQGSIEIAPGRMRTVSMALARRIPGMSAGPPAYVGDQNGSVATVGLDMAHVASLQFFLDHPKAPVALRLGNLRLARSAAITGLVDRYGQYTRADWPGKIHADADLAADRRREAASLARAIAADDDRDEIGAWRGGPQLRATGWFRTERVDGRWWLVSPQGRLFWSTGLDCMGPDNGGPIKGRRDMLTWLPAASDPLSRYGGEGSDDADFYRMNCERKYGAGWRDIWMETTRRRMRAWGFNTTAAWSDPCYRPLRMPYAVTASSTWGARTITAAWGQFPDIYEPAWPELARKLIADRLALYRDDPLCIGYFVDNELPWGYHWDGSGCYVVPAAMLELPGDRAAKQAMVRLLRQQHPGIEALNAAWGTHFASWDEAERDPVRLTRPYSDTVKRDLSRLLTAVADRYFGTITKLVRQSAPHQMYLGQRFGGIPPREVVEAAERTCDVVSYNIYGDARSLIAHEAHIRTTTRPGIIGEFHFSAMDRGMFAPNVGNQTERGGAYAGYVSTAASLPWCVGAHWFTYVDQPLIGRFDGENQNIGYVSQTDTPYPELIQASMRANARVYRDRYAGRQPKP